MSVRSRLLVFLVSAPLVALVAVGGPLGAGAAGPAPQQNVSQLPVFQDVVRFILGAYVEEVNIDKVMDGAMRGLADALDPSSAFLTAEEVRALQGTATQPAGEVGLIVTRWGYLRIVGVRDGSPAARAGLQTGDFIRTIDDRPTRDMSAVAGTRLLRGTPGSRVSLLVFRGDAAEPHHIELVREAGRTDRASSRRLPGGEAYVRVASFGAGAASALQRSIATLGAAATTSGLIIDVRGTADGPADEGIAAARLFVRSGTIATLGSRQKPPAITTAASGDGALAMPVVLLTSTGTANGAEVFAAALQGNKRARLVGEPTAGIAGVQRLIPLEEGTGLWMTHARYLQQDGTPIHEQGLRPDVPVQVPLTGFDEPPPATDAILNQGLAELKRLRESAPAAAPGV